MADSIYKTHQPKSGGGDLYLRLKDGETARVRVVSQPAIYESKGERDGKETLTTRYAWLVWNQEKQLIQVMQQSGTFFKSIAGLAQDEEWGDPTGYDIKITRHGSGFNDTTYTVSPSTNRQPLDPSIFDQIEATDLLEKISVSPFTTQAYWLADFDQIHEQPVANVGSGGYDKAKATTKEPPIEKPPANPDIVIEDIGDEPVNLDDIPF